MNGDGSARQGPASTSDAAGTPQVTRFDLQPCTSADLELTYAITQRAMQPHVEQTWGAWNEAEQRQKHRDNFTPHTHRLVLIDGAVAGMIAVEEEPGFLWLVKLYLEPDHRGRGLGSALLEQVLRQASNSGRRVRLRVLRVNTRARQLYERHGFRVVQASPERFFMETGAPVPGSIAP